MPFHKASTTSASEEQFKTIPQSTKQQFSPDSHWYYLSVTILGSFSLEIRKLGALLNPVSNLSQPTTASRTHDKKNRLLCLSVMGSKQTYFQKQAHKQQISNIGKIKEQPKQILNLRKI